MLEEKSFQIVVTFRIWVYFHSSVTVTICMYLVLFHAGHATMQADLMNSGTNQKPSFWEKTVHFEIYNNCKKNETYYIFQWKADKSP